MNTAELEDATLDCWVERAEALRLNPKASITDRVNCRKFCSDLDLAAPIISRERIIVEQTIDWFSGNRFRAYKIHGDEVLTSTDRRMWHCDTYLDAAMLCYVVSVFGEEAGVKLIWDDGTVRYDDIE